MSEISMYEPNLQPNLQVEVYTEVSDDDRMIAVWLHGFPKNTQDAYGRDVRQFRDFLSRKPLKQIRLEEVQSYVDHLIDRGLTAKTRKRKINSIKSLFSFALRLGYLQVNVPAAIRQPKTSGADTVAHRLLTQKQVRSLLSVDCWKGKRQEARNLALLTFLYASGCRISEACNLRWRDVAIAESGHARVTFAETKSGKSRTVNIPGKVAGQLSALKTEVSSPDSKVFGLGRKYADRLMDEAVKSAGLPDEVSCHWLRHANATHSLENGCDLHVVRDSLGHSSIAVTNMYLEAQPDKSSSDYLSL